MIKNIILDVDGTLWNTTEIVAAAWNEAIAVCGGSRVHVTPQRLQQLFGKPMNVIGEQLFTDVEGEARDRLLDVCVEHEQRALRERELHILYPDVAESMGRLTEQGRRLFVVSNCQSGYIELFLQKNGFRHLVTDWECYGNTGRPKGDNIRTVLARNALSADETVYVGDTLGDEEAAREAGIAFVHAAYGFGQAQRPDYVIQAFRELQNLP